jgi:predicted aconitase with swiveling domain
LEALKKSKLGSRTIKCRKISKGHAKGEVIITKDPLSFLGGVDPKTGVVIDPGHELHGKKISGKILVIPSGKGSTVGSYVIFQMAKNNTAPKAIISLKAEPIIATGAIMAGIPLVDNLEIDILDILEDGDVVEVDADAGLIRIIG